MKISWIIGGLPVLYIEEKLPFANTQTYHVATDSEVIACKLQIDRVLSFSSLVAQILNTHRHQIGEVSAIQLEIVKCQLRAFDCPCYI